MRQKPTRAHDIHFFEGGVLFFDRRTVPICMECDICGAKSPDWAPDEDGRNWCLNCIEKWEKKHRENWADGSPLKQASK